MREDLEERARRLAVYILETRTTIRGAAGRFGISKSTVHTAVTNENAPSGKQNRRRASGAAESVPRRPHHMNFPQSQRSNRGEEHFFYNKFHLFIDF